MARSVITTHNTVITSAMAVLLSYDSTQAAQELGITRRHLVRLARKLGVGRVERNTLRLTPAELERVRRFKAQLNPSGSKGRPRSGAAL